MTVFPTSCLYSTWVHEYRQEWTKSRDFNWTRNKWNGWHAGEEERENEENPKLVK